MKKKIDELSDIEFHVTQENGTELPFQNKYWNFFEQGIYIDLLSGVPLFASFHKFESQCGWPSFSDCISLENLKRIDDDSLGIRRTEVRGMLSDSHLGHVFSDGPAPTYERYCINSASIKFVPFSELADHGYKSLTDIFLTTDKNE